MVLYRHEPSTSATFRYCRLRMFGYVTLRSARYKLDSSLQEISCYCVLTLSTLLSGFIELLDFFVAATANWFEWQETTFHSGRFIRSMPLSINDVKSKTFTAKTSRVPNQLRTRRLPISINNFTMPCMFTALQHVVRSCSDWIDLTDSFYLGDRKPCLIRVGLVPVSRRLPKANEGLDVTPIEILTW